MIVSISPSEEQIQNRYSMGPQSVLLLHHLAVGKVLDFYRTWRATCVANPNALCKGLGVRKLLLCLHIGCWAEDLCESPDPLCARSLSGSLRSSHRLWQGPPCGCWNQTCSSHSMPRSLASANNTSQIFISYFLAPPEEVVAPPEEVVAPPEEK